MENCPCCSDKKYEECCSLFIKGHNTAKTAEALMRSRYSAYAKGEIQYILDTIIDEKKEEFDFKKIEEWSKSSKWKKLEIVRADKGEEGDTEGVVEFIAHYDVKDKQYLHHEVATFKKVEDKWYFVDGVNPKVEQYVRDEPKIGRNDPCICGSGKKYKKCCLK